MSSTNNCGIVIQKSENAVTQSMQAMQLTTDPNATIVTQKMQGVINYLCPKLSNLRGTSDDVLKDPIITTFANQLPYLAGIPYISMKNTVPELGMVKNPSPINLSIMDAFRKPTNMNCPETVLVSIVPGSTKLGDMANMINEFIDSCNNVLYSSCDANLSSEAVLNVVAQTMTLMKLTSDHNYEVILTKINNIISYLCGQSDRIGSAIYNTDANLRNYIRANPYIPQLPYFQDLTHMAWIPNPNPFDSAKWNDMISTLDNLPCQEQFEVSGGIGLTGGEYLLNDNYGACGDAVYSYLTTPQSTNGVMMCPDSMVRKNRVTGQTVTILPTEDEKAQCRNNGGKYTGDPEPPVVIPDDNDDGNNNGDNGENDDNDNNDIPDIPDDPIPPEPPVPPTPPTPPDTPPTTKWTKNQKLAAAGLAGLAGLFIVGIIAIGVASSLSKKKKAKTSSSPKGVEMI